MLEVCLRGTIYRGKHNDKRTHQTFLDKKCKRKDLRREKMRRQMKSKVARLMALSLGLGCLAIGTPTMAAGLEETTEITNELIDAVDDTADILEAKAKTVLELAVEAKEFHFSNVTKEEENPEGRMAHNIYIDPDLSGLSGKYTAFSIDFMTENDAVNTYWSLCNWGMDLTSFRQEHPDASGGGAYCGFQNTVDGHKTILSFWETSYTNDKGEKVIHDAKRVYPNSEDERFGGEGEGTHYIGPFDWKENHWYRMMLRCIDSSKGTTIVEQWVMDLETGKWKLACSYDTGFKDSCLTGGLSQFMENYWGISSNEFRSIRVKNIYVKEKGSDSFKQILKASLGTDNFWDNKKGNFAFGSDGGTFWGMTCGYGPDVFADFSDNDANDKHGPRAASYSIKKEKNSPAPTDGEFQDVKLDQWYLDAVRYAKENGLMAGKGEGKFAPDEIITRAQFVTVLYNYEKKTNKIKDLPFDTPFKDVKKDEWYTQPVLWAAKNSITAGISKNQFGVDQQITREQFVRMLYLYAQTKGYKTKSPKDALKDFKDTDKISSWATDAMKWAVSDGLISGIGDGKISPETGATRAQCAQIMKKFVEKYAN